MGLPMALQRLSTETIALQEQARNLFHCLPLPNASASLGNKAVMSCSGSGKFLSDTQKSDLVVSDF